MATIEDIVIGSDTFKAYAHLTTGVESPIADADTYLAARIGSTWSTATTLEKQQAIISAARMLDNAVLWTGNPTADPQPREWPRDGATCDNEAVADGTIPDAIAIAQYELANILFLDSTVQDGSGSGSNVKSVKAGSAAVEFFSATTGAGETRLPTVVNDLVGCLIEGSTVAGGSFGTSDADSDPGYCKDDFDLTQGYP